jgi:hypothetical protein
MNGEIIVNLERLRKTRKLMVATPLLGPTSEYLQSMWGLANLISTQGLPASPPYLPRNQSDVALLRNKMTDEFLRSDCTDILQVDNDVGFEPMDVLAMMHFEKEVIGANCPRKQIDWNLIREAVILQPDISPEKLALMGATWMATISPDCEELKLGEPTPYNSLPAGFSLINRSAFERMTPFRPRFFVDEQRKITDFWSAGPHEDRWETEDYAFCRRFREVGGKVWLCPWIALRHEGMFTYQGDMVAVLNHFAKHKRVYTLLSA